MGGGGTSATTGAQASPALVDPDVFAARIEAPGVVAINVHTPNEGSTAGTDLTIAFDQIAESSELPVDRGTLLAVYCRSGNMSADTVGDLEALGTPTLSNSMVSSTAGKRRGERSAEPFARRWRVSSFCWPDRY